MDKTTLITKIHETPYQFVLVTAGCGSQAAADLLAVAGASQSILETVTPYHPDAMINFLNQKPDKSVSIKTAQRMAGRALTRAQLYASNHVPLFGVACTGAITTNREREGLHQACIAVWSDNELTTVDLIMEKEVRTRNEQNHLIETIILNQIAQSCGLTEQLPVSLREHDSLTVAHQSFYDASNALYGGDVPYFGIHDFGRIRYQSASPELLFSGSFNPLHQGHLELAQAVEKHLNKPVAFEISVMNVDKPPLTQKVVHARMAQFAGRWPIYLSSAPTFIEKARIFGATTFVVGYDTVHRILQPRYYAEHDETLVTQVLAELGEIGCKFLVAGRVDNDGKFWPAENLPVTAEYAHLFIPLPDFRNDSSSTHLRKIGSKGAR